MLILRLSPSIHTRRQTWHMNRETQWRSDVRAHTNPGCGPQRRHRRREGQSRGGDDKEMVHLFPLHPPPPQLGTPPPIAHSQASRSGGVRLKHSPTFFFLFLLHTHTHTFPLGLMNVRSRDSRRAVTSLIRRIVRGDIINRNRDGESPIIAL